MAIKRITTRDQLVVLAKDLRVRPDWHEPDEQEVSAIVSGQSFDNAGFWGTDSGPFVTDNPHSAELWVTLTQEGKAVAEVNLATLFAWATGYQGD